MRKVDGIRHAAFLPRCRSYTNCPYARTKRKNTDAAGMQRALAHLDVVLLRQELNVEGAGDVERVANPVRDALDALDRLDVELLRGQDERGVTRVHAGVLDVLGDRVVENVAYPVRTRIQRARSI